MHGPRQSFRADVEGLRGVAVLLVVAFHVGLAPFSGGFVGVDVFFVISGYLITALLVAEAEQTGAIRISAFLARRVRRLLPAATVVFLATLGLAAIVLPPLSLAVAATATGAAATYVSNVHFLRLASDYFSGDVRTNPLLHTWSLSVEEQFYLVWPWIIFIAATQLRGARLVRRRLAWTLAIISALSFGGAAFVSATHRSLAFYATPLRAWEFAAGGMAWLVPGISVARRGMLGWIGLALVAAAAVLYSAATDFPGVTALLPVAGTALMLVAGSAPSPIGERWHVGRFLGARPLAWVGSRSYSWYLWHWPLLVLGVVAFPSAGLGARTLLALAALGLADVTYRWVETPPRRSAWFRERVERRPRDVIQLAVIAATLVFAVAYGTRRFADVEANSPSQRAFTAAAADVPAPYRDGCVTELGSDRVHVCTYGTPHGARTIALFGDSHAVQWFPALDSIARLHQWTLLVIAKSRCATAGVPVYEVNSHVPSLACEAWRRAAMDTIEHRGVDLVVITNASVYIRTPRLAAGTAAVDTQVWETGLAATLRRLQTRHMSVAVVRDTPLLSTNVPLCLARSGWLGHVKDNCGTDRDIALSRAVEDAERRAVAAVPGVSWIDLTNRLCLSSVCPAVIGGIVAYSDNEHVSARMARSLSAALDSLLPR